MIRVEVIVVNHGTAPLTLALVESIEGWARLCGATIHVLDFGRLLAVGSPKRSPLFPDVPTLDEMGLKGFDADTVFGFYAPAGTPAPVVAKLNAEINKALATPAVRERIAAIGGVPAPMTPVEFGAKAAEDSKRFGAIVKERKIVGD